ncbi:MULTISPECIES: hypothetical protein [unclassified Rickettsia]
MPPRNDVESNPRKNDIKSVFTPQSNNNPNILLAYQRLGSVNKI